MQDTTILLPMIAMAALTFVVGALVPIRRFDKKHSLTQDDFTLGESTRVPPEVSLPNRNFANLFEAPVLFYPAMLTFYVTRTADAAAVWLAWGYVALRVLHTLVHVTSNTVRYRALAFTFSMFVLMGLWGLLAWRIWPT
ncbi:MAG: hypothetical protein EON95_16205 [Caulobacteraceae bacterium]|nr:MAG: hypothetical protein EON95_16205 [Caulobacteraceae bacterium]